MKHRGNAKQRARAHNALIEQVTTPELRRSKAIIGVRRLKHGTQISFAWNISEILGRAVHLPEGLELGPIKVAR